MENSKQQISISRYLYDIIYGILSMPKDTLAKYLEYNKTNLLSQKEFDYLYVQIIDIRIFTVMIYTLELIENGKIKEPSKRIGSDFVNKLMDVANKQSYEKQDIITLVYNYNSNWDGFKSWCESIDDFPSDWSPFNIVTIYFYRRFLNVEPRVHTIYQSIISNNMNLIKEGIDDLLRSVDVV